VEGLQGLELAPGRQQMVAQVVAALFALVGEQRVKAVQVLFVVLIVTTLAKHCNESMSRKPVWIWI